MIERDWTLTDQACADDDRRHREWWRRDPFAEPDYHDGTEHKDEPTEDGSQSPLTSDGEGKSEGLMPTEPNTSEHLHDHP